MSLAASRRSLLIPIATTVFIVAVLLALGVWQLERRVDKLALIAALDERLAAAPVALPPAASWGELTPQKDEFRRVTLSGVLQASEPARVFASPSPLRKGWLTPHADRSKRLWFLRDHLAMAQALGWAGPLRLAPFYVDIEGPVPPGGVPKPGPLQVSLKNDHLQYAVTWFLLAAAVTIAFGFWLKGHRKA
jgi:surfeit locus 1 family protein